MEAKRLLAALLAASMFLSAAGCSAEKQEDGEEEAEPSSSEEASSDKDEEEEEEPQESEDREEASAPDSKPENVQPPKEESKPDKTEPSKSEQSSSSAPEKTDRTALKTGTKRTYENKELGLKIEFPQEWADCYTAVVKKDQKLSGQKCVTVEFLYKDDADAAMAVVAAMPVEFTGSMDGYSELGKNKAYKFYGATANGNPYEDGPDAELFNKLHFPGNKLVGMTSVSEPSGEGAPSQQASKLSKEEQEQYWKTYVEPLGGIMTQSWGKSSEIPPASLMIFALSQARADGKDPEKDNDDYIPRNEVEWYVGRAFGTDGSELRAYPGYNEEQRGYKNDMGFGGGPLYYSDLSASENGGRLSIAFGLCTWDDAKNDVGKPYATAALQIKKGSDGSVVYLSNTVTEVK